MKRPPLNRLPVSAPAQMYQTFGIRAPEQTHWQPATCEDVGCEYHARGFKVSVDESTPIGSGNAAMLRSDKTRSPKEYRDEFGMTIFQYPAGTRCMGKHTKRLDRQEIFIVKGGDHRGNPKGTPTRTHTKPEFWVEEFAETQEKIIQRIEMRD